MSNTLIALKLILDELGIHPNEYHVAQRMIYIAQQQGVKLGYFYFGPENKCWSKGLEEDLDNLSHEITVEELQGKSSFEGKELVDNLRQQLREIRAANNPNQFRKQLGLAL